MQADAVMAIAILAGWAFLRLQVLSWRQWWYRYWYLRSPHWIATARAKRAEVKWKCEKCHERKRLDVHHKTYKRLGKERMSDLQALCRDCHDKEHRK